MRSIKKAPGRAFFLQSGRPVERNLLFNAVLLAEFVDASGGVDQLLLAGVEGVAGGGSGFEGVAAAARHRHLGVGGMNIGFHWNQIPRFLPGPKRLTSRPLKGRDSSPSSFVAQAGRSAATGFLGG